MHLYKDIILYLLEYFIILIEYVLLMCILFKSYIPIIEIEVFIQELLLHIYLHELFFQKVLYIRNEFIKDYIPSLLLINISELHKILY